MAQAATTVTVGPVIAPAMSRPAETRPRIPALRTFTSMIPAKAESANPSTAALGAALVQNRENALYEAQLPRSHLRRRPHPNSTASWLVVLSRQYGLLHLWHFNLAEGERRRGFDGPIVR